MHVRQGIQEDVKFQKEGVIADMRNIVDTNKNAETEIKPL